MSNTLLLKRSAVANATPATGNLALGELAINTNDGLLFTKIDNGVPAVIDLTKTQLTGDATGNRVGSTGALAVTLANTGVVANTYGSGASIPSFTVDSKGRITSASENPISFSTNSISNGTSNVSIPTSDGNVLLVAGGTTTGTITSTGANITGYINVSGNANVGNLGTSGNISALYFIGNGSQLTGVSASSANAETLTGTFIASGVVGSSLTSVGTLGNLTVSGNANVGNLTATNAVLAGSLTGVTTINASGNANVGNLGATGLYSTTLNASGNANVGNIGGTNAVFTNLTGTLTTAAQPNVTSVGTLTSLTTSGNVLAANVNSNAAVTGVTGTFSGNVSGGNLTTAGAVVATGNITGGNISTTGSGGNITGANVVSATTFTATANVSAGNLVSSGVLSVTGNANVGNLGTSGNINASYFLGNGSQLTGVVAASANAETLTGTFLATNVVTSSLTTVGTLGSLSVTGNASAGNLSATNIAGTLTTAAQTNITSVGTLGSLAVTANISGGNIVSNVLTGSGVTIISAGNLSLQPTGNISVNSRYINNLLDPEQAQDAATKLYVDTVAQGLDAKASVHTATYAALPAYTYNNGTGGIGATLTAQAVGNLVVDGDTILSGQRVLVKNEVGAYVNPTTQSAAFNGIYVCTTQGTPSAAFVLTRATDFDVNTEMYGAFTFSETGTNTADTGWVCTNNSANPVTVGTTEITWTQFSGAGQYTAGVGLGLDGTQFYLANTAVSPASYGNASTIPTFTVNQQGQLTAAGSASPIEAPAANLTGTTLNSTIVTSSLTTVGTLGSLSVTGNVGAGNVSGTLLTGTLTTAAQPNVTSVGTLTSLSVTGNASAGNLSGTNIVGTLTTAAQPNITSIGNLSVANIGTATISTLANVTATTISTSTTSGALIVAGGVGVAGNVYATDLYKNGVTVLNANDTIDGGTY